MRERAALVQAEEGRQQRAAVRGAERVGDRFVERPPRRIDHQLDFRVPADLGLFLGEHERAIEPAELVDEANLLRLLAGPDTALRDRVDLLRRRAPAGRGLLDEGVVGRLHLLAGSSRALPA